MMGVGRSGIGQEDASVADQPELMRAAGEVALVDATSVPDLHHHGIAGWAGRRLRAEYLNWRLALVRLLTSGVAVVLTVLVIPGLRFRTFSVGEFLLIGAVFGLLNAVVKPLLQFFTLRYLLPTYGLVVVLINAALLALLSWLLGQEISVRGAIPLLLGGVLVGFFGLVLDTIFGTTPPILDRAAVFDTGSRSADADREPAVPVVSAAGSPPPISADADSAEGQDVLRQAAAVLAGGDPQPAPDPVPRARPRRGGVRSELQRPGHRPREPAAPAGLRDHGQLRRAATIERTPFGRPAGGCSAGSTRCRSPSRTCPTRSAPGSCSRASAPPTSSSARSSRARPARCPTTGGSSWSACRTTSHRLPYSAPRAGHHRRARSPARGALRQPSTSTPLAAASLGQVHRGRRCTTAVRSP